MLETYSFNPFDNGKFLDLTGPYATPKDVYVEQEAHNIGKLSRQSVEKTVDEKPVIEDYYIPFFESVISSTPASDADDAFMREVMALDPWKNKWFRITTVFAVVTGMVFIGSGTPPPQSETQAQMRSNIEYTPAPIPAPVPESSECPYYVIKNPVTTLSTMTPGIPVVPHVNASC